MNRVSSNVSVFNGLRVFSAVARGFFGWQDSSQENPWLQPEKPLSVREGFFWLTRGFLGCKPGRVFLAGSVFFGCKEVFLTDRGFSGCSEGFSRLLPRFGGNYVTQVFFWLQPFTRQNESAWGAGARQKAACRHIAVTILWSSLWSLLCKQSEQGCPWQDILWTCVCHDKVHSSMW